MQTTPKANTILGYFFAFLGAVVMLAIATWVIASTSQQVEQLTNPMAVPRTGHAATALSDGRILITGGHDSAGNLVAVSEIYDPATKTSTASATLTSPRAGHTATLLGDGRVLVAGGTGGSAALSSAEIFDGSGFLVVGSMTTARTGHTATVLNDGTVLISGGEATGTAEIFDPTTQTFSATSGTMTVARSGHTATLFTDDSVLLAGGNTNSMEMYSPLDQHFTADAAMSVVRTGHWAFELSDTRLLLFQGDTGNTIDEFNPTPPGTIMPKGSLDFHASSATLLANGKVLVLSSGVAGLYDPNAVTPESDFTAFDGTSVPGSSSLQRSGQSATQLSGDKKIFVAGGTNAQNLFQGTALFNPAHIWTDKDDYSPGDNVILSGSGWKPNENVYLYAVDDQTQAWTYGSTVAADAKGGFIVDPYFVVQLVQAGANFSVSAVGAQSNMQTDVKFTDSGNPDVAIVTPTGFIPLTIVTGGSITVPYAFTFNTCTSGGSCPSPPAPVNVAWTVFLSNGPNDYPIASGTITVTARASTNIGTAAAPNNVLVTADGGAGVGHLPTAPATYKLKVMVTQPTNNSKSDTSSGNWLTVTPVTVHHFLVERATGGDILDQTQNVPFNIKITAQDASNNTLTGFGNDNNDKVNLTSTPAGLSGAPVATPVFANGVLNSFAVTITNTGSSFAIIATQAGTPPKPTGTSNSFAVNAACTAPSSAVVSPSGTVIKTVGDSISFSVAANGTTPLHYQWHKGLANVGTDSNSYSIGSVTTADAGDYDVTVTNSCGSITSAKTTLTVNKIATTLTVATASGTYGGTVNLSATLKKTSDSTPISGKSISFTLNGNSVGSASTDSNGQAKLDNINLCGPSYKIDAGPPYLAGVGASFAADSSYETSSGTNSLTVGQATLTITATTNTKPYDCTTSAAATPNVSGTKCGDTVTGLVEEYADPNAGTGKTLSVTSYTVNDGNGGNNYAVNPVANTTGVITKLPSSTTVTVSDTVYNCSPQGGTASVTSGSGSCTLNQSLQVEYIGRNATVYGPTLIAPTDAGDYTAQASYLGDINHEGSQDSKDFAIAKLPSTTTVTAAGATFTCSPYVGASASVTSGTGSCVLNQSLPVKYIGRSPTVYGPSNTAPTNAGDYTAQARYPGDNNHLTSQDAKDFTIAKANATINITPYNVTYDHNSHTATGTATGVCSDSLSGLDLSGTTHTNPGDYNDSWTFTDVTGNYNDASGTLDSLGVAHDVIHYGTCSGSTPGGVILPPINSDGSSVYNRKGSSTIPVKFIVCDSAGLPISDPAAVFGPNLGGGSISLLGAVRGTVSPINEEPTPMNIPDVAFRYSNGIWIFNMAISNLNAPSTYTFKINLAYGSITFRIGVK
jgi:hypothetical protein